MTSNINEANPDQHGAETAGMAAWLIRRTIPSLAKGRLTLFLPNRTTLSASAPEHGPHAQINLRRWRALFRLVYRGDIGFATAYADDDWTTPDLASVLAFGMANESALAALTRFTFLPNVVRKLYHRLRRNSLTGSRKNIEAHYDLGNDFYAAWLDPDLIYSSAIFQRGKETLEEAQAAKLNAIENMLSLRGGERVLEIGCGWGALAERLARNKKCNVTGLTLSHAQLLFSSRRLRRAGLNGLVNILPLDYRESAGKYDRVVSIEMLEAVGEEFWPVYFRTVRERLNTGGIAVLQAITIAAERFEAYRQRPDFIQRYIFPGGMLPTDTLVRRHAAKNGLRCVEAIEFGDSYAKTLAIWRNKFLAADSYLDTLGYEPRFRKLWAYYLSYCEAGFASGATSVALYRFEAV